MTNLIVGYDPAYENDVGCLTVGQMCGMKGLILNHVYGEEAKELYDKLVGTRKPLSVEGDRRGKNVKFSFVDEVHNWPNERK